MQIPTGDGKEFPTELFDLLEERRKQAGDGGMILIIGTPDGIVNGTYTGKYYARLPLDDSQAAISVHTLEGEKFFHPHEVKSILTPADGGIALNALYFKEDNGGKTPDA